jgi:hypothetical protein
LLHGEGAVFACGGTMQDYVVNVSHIDLMVEMNLMIKVWKKVKTRRRRFGERLRLEEDKVWRKIEVRRG